MKNIYMKKSTEKHNYLHCKNSHPKHLMTILIYSQSVKIKIIYTDLKTSLIKK